MIIREAELADIESLLSLGNAFFSASGYSRIATLSPEILSETMASLITSDSGILLLAELEGRPVGMIGAVAFRLFMAPQSIAQELFWWVSEGARGGGAGRLLMESCEAWAASEGCSAMIMLSLSGLPDADRMYIKSGYEPAEKSFIKVI